MKLFKILVLSTTLLTGVIARADVPATHGMLLFGDKSTYLSHLPMYHSPHDYQVILKVTLKDLPRSSTLLHYGAAKAHGQGLFTLVPQKVDLTKVIDGSIPSLNGEIFQGHFEQGGKPLGWVQVQIEKVIFSSKLDGSLPTETESKYLAFGGEGEYFAAHLIQGGMPSFDQVLQISTPYELQVFFCRTRACAAPEPHPISDDELPLTLPAAQLPKPGDQLGEMGTPLANVVKVLYHEDADLSH